MTVILLVEWLSPATMLHFLHPTPSTLISTGILLVIAYAGYTQSWAFSGKDMGLAPPPLANIFEHLPYGWETWVMLIAPLALTLRLIGAEDLFNQGPAWFFWTLQALYFYVLAAALIVAGEKLTHRIRRNRKPT